MCRTIITNGTIVNDGEHFIGSIIVKGEFIESVIKGKLPENIVCNTDRIIDASGKWILPGVIDDQVHFREPGLTHKAEIATESVAAVAGGITSFMEMPNTVPQTTTLEALEWKYSRAAEVSPANYSFYIGATNDNFEVLKQVDFSQVCGVKIFMGSSTGNMLVDKTNSLLNIFNGTDMLIATHCESQEIIKKNTEYYKKMFSDAPEVPISKHPNIRSSAACYASTELAVRMASLAGARLHVLHVSTAKELQLFSDIPLEEKHITAEACVAHLLYRQQDYKELGTRIKCNPSIKKQADRDALRNAVNTGVIDVIATDHAPHLLSEKEGGALKAMSGMPMIQFSLVSMLELAEKGIFSIETIVEKMCHAPAQIYGICDRGYVREGYKADLVLVSHGDRWEVNSENILSKCGWSPLEGNSFRWKVERTFANGHLIYSDGQVDDTYRGEELRFDYKDK